MPAIPRAAKQAAERWGYLAEGQAHRYGVKNGASLLLKIAYVESGLGANLGPSSAGARGWTQFEPSTRAAYIKQYGVDPWKNADEAFHATALFMKHTGLAGYNPGSATYIHEVLKAPVGLSSQSPASAHPGLSRAKEAVKPAPEEETSLSEDLMHFGLVGVLVLGGGGMILFGTTRLLGTKGKAKGVAP